MTTRTDRDGRQLDASAVARDAPYIGDLRQPPQFNGQPATVTFVDLQGNAVETQTTTYQAGTTVRFVYPGRRSMAPATRWTGPAGCSAMASGSSTHPTLVFVTG